MEFGPGIYDRISRFMLVADRLVNSLDEVVDVMLCKVQCDGVKPEWCGKCSSNWIVTVSRVSVVSGFR